MEVQLPLEKTKLNIMKLQPFLLLSFFGCLSSSLMAQRVLSEGTLTYTISVEPSSTGGQGAGALNGATYSVFLNGNKSRTEMVSTLGKEATIHDAATGSGVILKEYSGQNLMITLTPQDWQNNNQKFQGITFQNTGATAKIAGFNCTRVMGKLKDGSDFSVYYTLQVTLSNQEYDPRFLSLPGLPVQYEMRRGSGVYKFTLSKIDYGNVPASKFEIPQSGYRVMPYKEVKKN
jgi:GLPGLI family protein